MLLWNLRIGYRDKLNCAFLKVVVLGVSNIYFHLISPPLESSSNEKSEKLNLLAMAFVCNLPPVTCSVVNLC